MLYDQRDLKKKGVYYFVLLKELKKNIKTNYNNQNALRHTQPIIAPAGEWHTAGLSDAGLGSSVLNRKQYGGWLVQSHSTLKYVTHSQLKKLAMAYQNLGLYLFFCSYYSHCNDANLVENVQSFTLIISVNRQKNSLQNLEQLFFICSCVRLMLLFVLCSS